jgi:hypothetical protein
MEGELQFEGFSALVTTDKITLTDERGGQLSYTPGQVENLRDFVGALQKVGSLPAFPPEVPGEGFVAKLKGDGTAEVFKDSDDRQYTIGFRFSMYNGWPVVEAIDATLAKARDIIASTPKQTGNGPAAPGSDGTDLIEGMI